MMKAKPKTRRTNRAATLDDLWDRWLDEAKAAGKNLYACKSAYRYLGEQWGPRKLSEILRSDVAALHSRIGKDSPGMANWVLTMLIMLYNRAPGLVGWAGENPGRGIKRFPTEKRTRFLTPAEIQALVGAIGREDRFWRAFWLAMLCTGQEAFRVRRMRWTDIDLEHATWTIPVEFCRKAKRPMVVVLPYLAVEALQTLKADPQFLADGRQSINAKLPAPIMDALAGVIKKLHGSHWVFASRTSNTGYMVEIRETWKRIKAAAGIVDPDVTPYTVRNTMRSYLAAAGASHAIILAVTGWGDSRRGVKFIPLTPDKVRGPLDQLWRTLLSFSDAGEQDDAHSDQGDQGKMTAVEDNGEGGAATDSPKRQRQRTPAPPSSSKS
jgi:integrase